MKISEWPGLKAILFPTTGWNNSILFVTLLSLVIWGIWHFLYKRLIVVTKKTHVQWDNLLIQALKTPISAIIWCWPATLSLGFALKNNFSTSLDWLDTCKSLMVLGIILWILSRLTTNIELYLISTKHKDETTVQAISKIVKLFFIVFGLLSFLQAFGLSLSGLLTFGGVGGLIVGFAAKDLLSNFFGGLMIYFDRPFKVGDWVLSPDRNIEGTVERIGWRMTIIRTFDKRPLYVPNCIFSNIIVENPSRMQNRRIYETVGIRYGDNDKMEKIIKEIKKMLEEHPDIETRQTLIVNFNQFGRSSLDFFIYTFTKTVNWIRYHEVKQDVLLRTISVIRSNGAEIAYQTQTIKLTKEEGVPK